MTPWFAQNVDTSRMENLSPRCGNLFKEYRCCTFSLFFYLAFAFIGLCRYQQRTVIFSYPAPSSRPLHAKPDHFDHVYHKQFFITISSYHFFLQDVESFSILWNLGSPCDLLEPIACERVTVDEFRVNPMQCLTAFTQLSWCYCSSFKKSYYPAREKDTNSHLLQPSQFRHQTPK